MSSGIYFRHMKTELVFKERLRMNRTEKLEEFISYTIREIECVLKRISEQGRQEPLELRQALERLKTIKKSIHELEKSGIQEAAFDWLYGIGKLIKMIADLLGSE